MVWKGIKLILYVRIVLGNIRKCRHCIIQNEIFFVLLCGLEALCMKYKQLTPRWTIVKRSKVEGAFSYSASVPAFHHPTVKWCRESEALYGLQTAIAKIPFQIRTLACLKLILCMLPSTESSFVSTSGSGLHAVVIHSRLKVSCFASARCHI